LRGPTIFRRILIEAAQFFTTNSNPCDIHRYVKAIYLVLDPEPSSIAIESVSASIGRIVSAVCGNSGSQGSKSRETTIKRGVELFAEASVRLAGGFPSNNINDERDYLCSNGFLSFLQTYSISIAFSSFPLSLLFIISQDNTQNCRLKVLSSLDVRGLHSVDGKILVGCENYIAELVDNSEIRETSEGKTSHLFIPKLKHSTGNLDIHDIVLSGSNDIVFANTRYSCPSSVYQQQDDRAIWQPCFISELVPEDRCHLNGVAIREGNPAFISAVATTDVIDGWRKHRADGGVIVDVAYNRVICRGLSMPHSPRFYNNRLWVLNSGGGELGFVKEPDRGDSRFKVLTYLPGFLRGLAFVGPYAVVGLSKPRYGAFEGLPLQDRLKKKGLPPWSGIAVVDTRSGDCVEWFRLTGRVREVSDLAVLYGVSRPTIIRM